MVKHVILWQFKEEITPEQKVQIKAEMKETLEALKGVVPGLIDIKIVTEYLPSSNAEVMLDSSFENEEALKAYAVHPAHVKAANEKVRPFVTNRSCMDFEV